MAIASTLIWASVNGSLGSLLRNRLKMRRVKLTQTPIKSIIKIENYGETEAGTILVTATAHGLSNGDYITIADTTNYDGTYEVTKVTNDTFYVTKAYVEDETAGNLYAVYSTGGFVFDLVGLNDMLEPSTQVILEPNATNSFIYDKANNKIIVLDARTSVPISANTDISSLEVNCILLGR